MTFAERVETILEEKSITKSKILSDLNLGKNQFTYWKSKGTIPNGFTVQAIAEYLNVSVEYLKGETEEKEKQSLESSDELSEERRKLYSLIGKLSPEHWNEAESYLTFLIDSQNKKQQP